MRKGNYEDALQHLEEAIEKLESLQGYTEEGRAFHQHAFEGVNNTSYYGAIVRRADEYGYKPCVLGVLKAVRDQLKDTPQLL